MPNTISSTAVSNTPPMNPFVGPVNHTHALAVNIAALTTAEVDAAGFLKPGVPLSSAGVLVGSTVAVFGVTIEPVKVAASNSSADLTAAGTKQVAVSTFGQVNRKIAEDVLGRVYTANEIAGFSLAGSTLKLLA